MGDLSHPLILSQKGPNSGAGITSAATAAETANLLPPARARAGGPPPVAGGPTQAPTLSSATRTVEGLDLAVPNYAFTSEIFPAYTTWTAPVGTRQTYKVWQRTDIDRDMIRTEGSAKFIGKTNLEAALGGKSPQLNDGFFATLHHFAQDSRGGLAEASTRIHDFKSTKLPNGKKLFDVLHSQHGPKGKHPAFPVDHGIWQREALAYWKARAADVLSDKHKRLK